MSARQPIIRLWQLDGPGLILSHPSGVRYSNQAGGYACRHPELEGAFVSLTDPDFPQQQALDEHFFYGPKWAGHCYAGIDEETAAFVDRVLVSSPLTKRLTVDRSRLAESIEAWIHVVVDPGGEDADWDLFAGFPSGRGVFTWENSD